MGLEKKKEESKSSHVPSSLPPICMLTSAKSWSSSNKVNKVTFGYHVLLDEMSLYSPTHILLTLPAIPPHSIPYTLQQSLPSQSAREEAFVAFLISKRALVCSLVHPAALTQAKGDEAMKAKAQTKMTFLAKQEVSISKVILF